MVTLPIFGLLQKRLLLALVLERESLLKQAFYLCQGSQFLEASLGLGALSQDLGEQLPIAKYLLSEPNQLAIYLGQITSAIYLLMEKLGQIVIDNTLNVNVNCHVDQSLLARNFSTIVEALKELQKAQSLSDQRINDLSSLKEGLNSLAEKLEKVEKNSSQAEKEAGRTANLPSTSNQHSHLSSNLADLTKRVEKSEANIFDNIKDINLLNSDLRDAKNEIEDLKKKLSLFGASTDQSSKPTGYGVQQLADNLSKELKKSEESMRSILERLSTAEENIQRLDEELKSLRKKDSQRSQSNNANKGDSGPSNRQLDDLRDSLRDKLDVINKKINMLQADSNDHTRQISYLKELMEEGQGQDSQKEENSANNKANQSLSVDLFKLKKRVEDLDSRENKDVRQLQEQIDSLRQQLKAIKTEKIQSKTSLEDQNPRSNRKLTINRDRDELNDKINDLIMKVNYLEKLIAGSKNSFGDERNPQKLPSIHRPKKRDPNITGFQDREKSGIGRKDLAELKAELQAWLKGLLDSLLNRQNFQNLQLKIQQIKKNLQKKADAEGTKKGFAFLQNKITQLYLFLTEPETEDAMIARKGFSCLSCSKKIEKLRGKIGPKINWNNMTATNYTPPKVGYSKPMGDRSIDKEDDL